MPTEYLPGQLELFEEKEMGKVTSTGDRAGFFPKGGNTKMFGKGSVGRVTPGQSGKESNAPSGGSEKWPKGGSGKMFGKQSANKAPSGQSGKAG